MKNKLRNGAVFHIFFTYHYCMQTVQCRGGGLLKKLYPTYNIALVEFAGAFTA